MLSTKNPDVEALAGKKAISQSFRKAVQYLLKSHFDQRSITKRGLFDRSLMDLFELNKELRINGQRLNKLNKSYFSGEVPGEDRVLVLKTLADLMKQNIQIIERFSETYKLNPDK